MNDEETVALIAGGHTFGKAHGAGDPSLVGTEPEGCPVHAMRLGWKNEFGKGKAEDTITCGLEGAWTPTPTTWDNSYFDTLFGFEWELTESPAGAKQWKPDDRAADALVPDAHLEGVTHAPMMATTDVALITDPCTGRSRSASSDNPEQFADCVREGLVQAAAPRHGPGLALPRARGCPSRSSGRTRCPAATTRWSATPRSPQLKQALLASGLTVPQLVRTAWASASSFRSTDKRGGANGARLRLEPQISWAVNEGVADVLPVLERVKADFEQGGARISLADLIVLGGCAAVEKAARRGRRRGHRAVHARAAPTPRRSRPTSSRSRCLEPRADGFRNYLEAGSKLSPETLLVDRAYLLELTAKELTVLVGGLRALGANTGGAKHGVFTDRPGVLTQRLLRQPARPRDAVAHLGRHRGRLRGRRRRRGRPHRHRRRPGLRLELDPARHLRGLLVRRQRAEVRARLRRRLGQGHGPRPLRPALVLLRRPGSASCGPGSTRVRRRAARRSA